MQSYLACIHSHTVIGKAAYKHNPHEKTGKDEKISGSSTRREGQDCTVKRTPLKSMHFSEAGFGVISSKKKVYCVGK